MGKKYFIIAANMREAETFARENNISKSDLVYVSEQRSIAGVTPGTLYIVGRGIYYKFNREIIDYAKHIGWKLDFNNKIDSPLTQENS